MPQGKKIPGDSPFAGVDAYELADASAVQAMARGEATKEQQPRALKFIVEKLAATYDQSFRPGSDRDTSFVEGRRFVGLQIVKLTTSNLSHLRKKNG